MKKLILFFPLFVVITFFGCIKNETCEPVSPYSESDLIENYALANGMNVTAHASGLYYEILDPGNNTSVSPTSYIYITYVGKLLDGRVFSRMDTPNQDGWALNGLIEGWRLGIPLIQKGGRIRLIVPSAMAYGCKASGSLPGNSVLFFDIRLIDVK